MLKVCEHIKCMSSLEIDQMFYKSLELNKTMYAYWYQKLIIKSNVSQLISH